jgi:hypothetical protein
MSVNKALDPLARRELIQHPLLLCPFTDAMLIIRPHSLLTNPLDNLLRRIEQTRRVRRNDIAPVLPRHFAEDAIRSNAGIVHEHVNLTDFFLCPGEGGFRRFPVPQRASPPGSGYAPAPP